MKQLLDQQIQEELELNRASSSVWEKVFRFGIGYLLITTTIGTIAGAIFGEHEGKEPMPLWAWFLVVPYIFFMGYCSNYMVYRYVKNKLVRGAWFGLMGLIILISLGALIPE